MIGCTAPLALLVLTSTLDVHLKSSVVPPEDLRVAEFTLREMVDMRERMRTGVVRATGTILRNDSPDQSGGKSPVEIYSVFDNPAGLFRFDLSSVKQIDNEDRAVRAKFVRTPKRTLRWRDPYDPHRVIIDKVNAKPSTMDIVFDMRVTALTGPAGLQGVSMQTLDAVCESLSNDVEVTAVKEDGQILQLDAQSVKSKFMTSSLWLDRSRGCTPVRVELHMGNARPYHSITEVSWIELSDTWVPSAFSMSNYRMGDLEDQLELAFSWESVNEVVDETLFTAESLGLPGDTELVSRELGDTEIFLGTIDSSSPIAGPPQPRGVRGWLLGLAVLATLALVVAALAMKRRIRQIRRPQTADQEAGTQP